MRIRYLLGFAVLLASCQPSNVENRSMNNNGDDSIATVFDDDESMLDMSVDLGPDKLAPIFTGDATLAYKNIDGEDYVSADDLVAIFGMQHSLDEETGALSIGAADPEYEFKKEDVKSSEGKLFVKRSSLVAYLELEGVKHTDDSNGAISLAKLEQKLDDEIVAEEGEFADDPEASVEGLALKNISMSNLVRTARKYKGTKYKFGAKKYSSKNKRFDCSSFVQYVYGKMGVSLRRASKNQAKQGKWVSKKKLRVGDLLFFRVPSRGKGVGHVMIYVGHGRIIHAARSTGVWEGKIPKYWKSKYLTARRVAY